MLNSQLQHLKLNATMQLFNSSQLTSVSVRSATNEDTKTHLLLSAIAAALIDKKKRKEGTTN